ncbi:MAG: bifunctional phosphopantothenoylcysteine decarboxylase/phosphopantothenate--cysteine ligase CoaBC [Nitrospiraceae bacterium]|nr:MAG: bifunctional phosphopantothenoylcysteine decarboxylase/phosphopantothenate--cysteine ligase CoaBC [Nitrospiraceae bacterium]
MLSGSNVLLGITGSIAAYKAADLARRLMDEGAKVNVVMTDAACRFITPYTLESITGNAVHVDLFRDPYCHIHLAAESDLFIIAPATANTINKLSCGLADNLLSCLWLAYDGPALMAPAMNFRMYKNRTVQSNIKNFKKTGVEIIGPAKGSLACGEEGKGRMSEVSEIVEAAISVMSPHDLTGHKILVTAGPTREQIDPVRYISNRSSGKMGYALALAAKRRGADVTLVSGPCSVDPPHGVSIVYAETSDDMEKAVFKHLDKATAVIMSAAVSDFRADLNTKNKLDKNIVKSLKLNKTTDILKKLGSRKGKRFLIGFAAESGKNVKRASAKLKEKKLDLMVLNDISQEGAGFDTDTNIVTLIHKKGDVKDYPIMKKIEVAHIILDCLKKKKGSS